MSDNLHKAEKSPFLAVLSLPTSTIYDLSGKGDIYKRSQFYGRLVQSGWFILCYSLYSPELNVYKNATAVI